MMIGQSILQLASITLCRIMYGPIIAWTVLFLLLETASNLYVQANELRETNRHFLAAIVSDTNANLTSRACTISCTHVNLLMIPSIFSPLMRSVLIHFGPFGTANPL